MRLSNFAGNSLSWVTRLLETGRGGLASLGVRFGVDPPSPAHLLGECMATPRVLKVTFELHVPEGLPANINAKRLEAAVAGITAGVRAVVPTVFPWAARMTVSQEWSYRWDSEVIKEALPATEHNTLPAAD